MDNFFEQHMSKGSTGNLAFAGARSQQTGLYGYMKDIFMTSNREALQYFKEEMKRASAELYTDMRTDPNTPFQAKDTEKMGKEKPEFFFKDTPKDEMLPGTGYSTEDDFLAAYAQKNDISPEEARALMSGGNFPFEDEDDVDEES